MMVRLGCSDLAAKPCWTGLQAVIKQAEARLKEFSKQPGFAIAALKVKTDLCKSLKAQ
jgi:hypothetical protein